MQKFSAEVDPTSTYLIKCYKYDDTPPFFQASVRSKGLASLAEWSKAAVQAETQDMKCSAPA